MTVSRLAVSFDKGLAKQVRRAAGKESISAWLADAASRKLRSEGLRELVDDWQAEHGAFTDAERQEADRVLFGPRKK